MAKRFSYGKYKVNSACNTTLGTRFLRKANCDPYNCPLQCQRSLTISFCCLMDRKLLISFPWRREGEKLFELIRRTQILIAMTISVTKASSPVNCGTLLLSLKLR